MKVLWNLTGWAAHFFLLYLWIHEGKAWAGYWLTFVAFAVLAMMAFCVGVAIHLKTGKALMNGPTRALKIVDIPLRIASVAIMVMSGHLFVAGAYAITGFAWHLMPPKE